jgi:hypothetical protein
MGSKAFNRAKNKASSTVQQTSAQQPQAHKNAASKSPSSAGTEVKSPNIANLFGREGRLGLETEMSLRVRFDTDLTSTELPSFDFGRLSDIAKSTDVKVAYGYFEHLYCAHFDTQAFWIRRDFTDTARARFNSSSCSCLRVLSNSPLFLDCALMNKAISTNSLGPDSRKLLFLRRNPMKRRICLLTRKEKRPHFPA